ncbi:hypothetical protein AALA17_07440 [Lactobacillaceae bacterium 24-114]
MADRDYEQLLEDLHDGKIKEFEIKPEEFIEFQPIFHAYQFRTQISGEAHRGGTLTYRLKSSEQ